MSWLLKVDLVIKKYSISYLNLNSCIKFEEYYIYRIYMVLNNNIIQEKTKIDYSNLEFF